MLGDGRMPKLVIICGPQAVGKMTVGQELTKITDLKLFHNHMTIEPLLQIFEHRSKEFKELNTLFRHQIFEKFAKTDKYGLIFTYVWAFDMQDNWEYVENISKIFKENGGDVYIVELEADINERILRNKTENRLQNKPTKRNIECSEQELINCGNKYRLNSEDGEIKQENYFRINNTNLSAEDVAKMIKDKFEL